MFEYRSHTLLNILLKYRHFTCIGQNGVEQRPNRKSHPFTCCRQNGVEQRPPNRKVRHFTCSGRIGRVTLPPAAAKKGWGSSRMGKAMRPEQKSCHFTCCRQNGIEPLFHLQPPNRKSHHFTCSGHNGVGQPPHEQGDAAGTEKRAVNPGGASPESDRSCCLHIYSCSIFLFNFDFANS